MNRSWIAALPLLAACDDLPLADDDASATVASSSDVLVVHFEARSPESTTSDAQEVADEAERAAPAIEPRAAALRAALEAALEAGAEAGAEAAVEAAWRDARWVVHAGRLVLAQGEQMSAQWSEAAPRLTASASPRFFAERTLRVEALPEELRALPGREVKVFDREREVCVARVAGTASYRLTAELLHEQFDGAEDEVPVPITHSAAEVFDLGLTSLSAALEPLMGDCSKGLWASPVAAPTPILYRKAAVSASLRRQALAAFRALPEWRQAQHDMEHFYDDAPDLPKPRGAWDRFEGARPTVTSFVSQDGAHELALVVGDSVDGCGSPGQRLVALMRVTREPRGMRFETLGAIPWGTSPAGLVDIGGDGSIEVFAASGAQDLVLERWHALPDGGDDLDQRIETLDTFVVPDLSWYGCGC